MKKAVLLGAIFVLGCGTKASYQPDYIVEGRKFQLYEYPSIFKPYTETVKWLKEEEKWTTPTRTFIPAEVSTQNWNVSINGHTVIATHIPSGREYKVKLRIPFPMRHKAVVKEVNEVLYIKEPLDGKVYVIDPKRVEKEVGVFRRAYLYDDGIVVVSNVNVRFCPNYNMRKCKEIYRIGKKGTIERFFRVNGALVFYVEDYRWNEKVKGYRWLRTWFVFSPEGKEIARIPYISLTYGYNFPFWMEADKQYVYSREDYYSNPYGKPPIHYHYKNYAPPAIFVHANKVYYFSQGQKAGTLKSITVAKVIEGGKVKFEKVKEKNFGYADYALGFCGDKVLIRFEGIWYDPDTGKKVKCSSPIRGLF